MTSPSSTNNSWKKARLYIVRTLELAYR